MEGWSHFIARPRYKFQFDDLRGSPTFLVDLAGRDRYLVAKRRGALTAQVKQEGIFLHVGESETAMLYQIKEENGKFRLFFSKKTGLKFKKAFPIWTWSLRDGELVQVERRDQARDAAERFVEGYLRHCCVRCREQGWVYKTRGSGGIYGGGSSHGKGSRGSPHHGNPPANSFVFCPECRAKHEVGYVRRLTLGLML